MWQKGAMAYSQSIIQSKLDTYEFSRNFNNIEYIKGYFEDELDVQLSERVKKSPPQIVTIVVDFYSSTKVVLDWLDSFVQSGTLIYFDDIWAYHGHPENGQMHAILEINADPGRGNLTPVLYVW